jgi:hypothetical protein
MWAFHRKHLLLLNNEYDSNHICEFPACKHIYYHVGLYQNFAKQLSDDVLVNTCLVLVLMFVSRAF